MHIWLMAAFEKILLPMEITFWNDNTLKFHLRFNLHKLPWEFLSQYYLGQEYQGGPVDLIQNIDRYIKTDNITNLSESVVLNGNLSFSNSFHIELFDENKLVFEPTSRSDNNYPNPNVVCQKVN